MIGTIAAKELKSLFASPLAWIVLALLQLVLGYVFLKRLDDFLQIQSQLVQLASPPGFTELVAGPLFATCAIVFIFAVPLLGMRLVSEERRNQTMVLLTSAPISMTELVLGKYLGLVTFLALIITLVTMMPLSMAGATNLDYGLLASLVGGVLLLVLGFAAVSLYISCLTLHPMAAAFGGFTALIAMTLLGDTAIEGLRARQWVLPASFVQVFAPLKNFEPLSRGMVDTASIACSVLLVVTFLVLAIRHLDARRLRG
jgi:ABC-2 type transport system permease protein